MGFGSKFIVGASLLLGLASNPEQAKAQDGNKSPQENVLNAARVDSIDDNAIANRDFSSYIATAESNGYSVDRTNPHTGERFVQRLYNNQTKQMEDVHFIGVTLTRDVTQMVDGHPHQAKVTIKDVVFDGGPKTKISMEDLETRDVLIQSMESHMRYQVLYESSHAMNENGSFNLLEVKYRVNDQEAAAIQQTGGKTTLSADGKSNFVSARQNHVSLTVKEFGQMGVEFGRYGAEFADMEKDKVVQALTHVVGAAPQFSKAPDAPKNG